MPIPQPPGAICKHVDPNFAIDDEDVVADVVVDMEKAWIVIVGMVAMSVRIVIDLMTVDRLVV